MLVHPRIYPGYFGKVDRIPGLCYVVTRFLHVCFVPLVPLESCLIRELPGKRGKRIRQLWARPELLDDENGNLKIRIPISLKSLLLAWLRTAFVIGAFIGVVALSFEASENLPKPRVSPELLIVIFVGVELAILALVVAACAALFWLSHALTRPSPSRARELTNYLSPGHAQRGEIPKSAGDSDEDGPSRNSEDSQ
jgi:hypothetical protein